jgi:hypothetical protein
MLVSRYVEGPRAIPPERIFYVDSGGYRSDTGESRSFGRIHVSIYPPGDRLPLEELRDDLVDSVREKPVKAGLAQRYNNIWHLNKILGTSEDNFTYYELFEKCRQLTFRQRNMPLPLLKSLLGAAD